jgi:hypothetical protein
MDVSADSSSKPDEVFGRRRGIVVTMSKLGDVESEEEIREEMEELGVSNDAEGSPDVLMSGPVIQATVIILVLLLVAGALLLVF